MVSRMNSKENLNNLSGNNKLCSDKNDLLKNESSGGKFEGDDENDEILSTASPSVSDMSSCGTSNINCNASLENCSNTVNSISGGTTTNHCSSPTNNINNFSASGKPQTQFSWNKIKNEEFHFEVPPEAPVFTPTDDEFKNPLNYISKIRPIAEKYGICKIKPPSTWQPPFTVDVDKLRFTPRIQRLNELEAKTRVKLNFLDQIAKFWELQGSSLKIPMVERKALDLYSLHRIVQEEGGMEQTINNRKWSRVAARMGYPQGKSVGTILKSHYERLLYPFDVYTSGKTVDLKLELNAFDDHDYKPHCIEDRQQVTPPQETTARRSKRVTQQSNSTVKDPDKKLDIIAEIKKEIPEDETRTAELRRLQLLNGPKISLFKSPCKNRMNLSKSSSPKNDPKRRNQMDPLAKYICHTCERGDIEEAMLLCDGCDDSYHTFCLIPPLSDIPKGDWRCPKCVVEEVNKPIEAFGFEQAQREYTLQQFGDMADRFKSDYFNMPVHHVPTSLVEREFWRIVSSIDEDVTVEYGADLHTMDHGSGFPTKSSLYLLNVDQEYAESSWNLNNLPLLEESILGHINADISGMKVPWMYVGMCFATFCWHNEDHWSYSINYLHWGEPKTWYGVPGSKAESFEETMKSAAPELFHSQPDLLHQLVTIMNPNIIMNAGVPVYRTDQHAGEFVITFPRAYHAGFNQGYNFAEAVNFAPADWMKMGRECINHYSTLRRFCVFSHDELVCKMALDPDRLNFGIATACYLDMAEMVDCEKKLRKSLLEWGVTKAERQAFELIPDDERQCDVCKTTCFLSAVTCLCSKSLVCLRHYSELCKCPPETHTLRYRYTLDELPLMLKKLKIKAESFENWLRKIRDVINPKEPTTITLDELQELATEAVAKKFPNSVLLERLNAAVIEAEKCVTVIQQLDINKMRTRTRNSYENTKYKLTMDELEMFVQEIDNLWCIIKEGNSVRELQQMGKEFIENATRVLKQSLDKIERNEIDNLIDECNSLCIELPQIFSLKDRLTQVIWYNEVREYHDSDEKIPLNILKKLLNEGLKLTPDALIEKELANLDLIIVSVEEWEKMAKECFEHYTESDIVEMENLLKKGEMIRGNLPSFNSLKDALKKLKEWLNTVEILQSNENYPYFHTLENVVNRGKNIPFKLEELKKMEEHLAAARSWKDRTSRTFLKKKSPFTLMEALSPRGDAVMLPKKKTDENTFAKKFTEEMSPVQMVVSFKEAEEKEIKDMIELRQICLIKNPEKDKYCICKRNFFGVMFHCQLCKNWFHTSCVPPPKNTVRPRPINSTAPTLGLNIPHQINGREKDLETKYLCPSCLRSRRPRLETILSLLVSLQRLPIRIPEGEALQCLTERAMNWQDRARQVFQTSEITKAMEKFNDLSVLSTSTVGGSNNSNKTPNSKLIKSNKRFSKATSENSNFEDSSSDEEEFNLNYKDDLLSGNENLTSSSPTNIEHAYSVPIPSTPGQSTQNTSSTGASGKLNPITKSDPPLISISKSLKENLEELMMEGDLLEVSLDETNHIWRILNAAKPGYSELAYIHYKYTIMPLPTDNLVNIKKRKTDEFNVKKHVKLKKSNDSPVTPELTPLTTKTSNNNSSGGVGTSAEQTPGTKDNKYQTNFVPKMKRGRKLKVTQTIATNLGIDAITAAPATTASGGAGKKKREKKYGKKKLAQMVNNDEDKTSDEDEDCSATTCQRPTGREVDWVQCDGGCEKWFHMLCVGLNKNQIKPDDDFICINCKKPSAKSTATNSPSRTSNNTSVSKNSTNQDISSKNLNLSQTSSPSTTTTTSSSITTRTSTPTNDKNKKSNDEKS